MRKLFAILLVMCIAIFCVSNLAQGAEQNLNYRAVPGVTQEEIDAIEALKDCGRVFSYGALFSAEAYFDKNGQVVGYTADLCRLLSQLFDIKVVPSIYGWTDILEGMENKTIDFSGDFSLTPERKRAYLMSEPIAVRSIALFYREGKSIEKIENERTPVFGFLNDSVHQGLFFSVHNRPYKPYYIDRVEDAPAALENGDIDAFICNSIFEAIFEENSEIVYDVYSPLICDTVSLSTQNEELSAIISVFDKYIKSGGRTELYSRYILGIANYTRSVLNNSFTDVEKRYIDSHISENKKIPVVLESGNYPISFYNEKSREFQGIVPDLLEQITVLTGLQFENINIPEDDWAASLAKLESGEAAMISELLYMPSREGLFLWPDEPSCITRFALLSKSDVPSIEVYQMLGKRIGVEVNTAYHAVAKQWFPEVELLTYLSLDDAFKALEKAEIDLIMASENLLLSQTNYNEKPGFKINFVIDYTAESKPGFNINETVLLSIINKVYPCINSKLIVQNWINRVFDYSGQLAQAKVKLLLISTVLLLAFIILLAVFLLKNNRHRRDLSTIVKARTAQLEEKSATLSTIYNAIPDLLFSKDTQGRYTSCNPSFEAYAGLSEPKILGKFVSDIFYNIDSATIDLERMQDQKVMTEDISIVVEQPVTYPNGEQRLLETIKTSLRQNDAVVGMIGISRDITAHKAAQEAALEASKAKGSFLARMSHEIRTPLNVIIGMAEITKASADDTDKTIASVNQIIISSNHLLSMINDVLDMSKIESGNLEILNQPFNLQDALEETITIIAPRCEEKSLIFENSAFQIPYLVVIGDKLRLKQVLINLLSNAIKFTDAHGHVGFDVSILSESTEDVCIRFVVKDSGIGMSEEQIMRLFKPFEQADSSIAARFGGMGLGLSISNSLVQKMGGTISVKSVLGGGAKFSFELLFKKGERSLQQVNEYDREIDFSDARILLVEDIDINRLIVEELLAPTNVMIEEAENGCEAVEMLKRSKPGYYQLILMDIQMPEMNGYEATTQIRMLSRPEARDIPIIAMTANAYKEDIAQSLSAGMSGHIGKPIDVDELIKTLAAHLKCSSKTK